MGDFYSTKILVEVEVSHQFNPEQVIGLVTGMLNVPAVRSVKVVAAESNYKIHSKPMDKMCSLDLKNLPK